MRICRGTCHAQRAVACTRARVITFLLVFPLTVTNEMTILRRSERAMVRAMRGAKLMEKKRTEDLMEMLGLKETFAEEG